MEGSNGEMIEMLHDFVYQCVKNNVSRISEWHTTPEKYLKLLEEKSN